MNTTKLFVELIVIGLGPLAAHLILLSSNRELGLPIVKYVLATPSLVVALIGITYVLGIIMDRLCDKLFHKLSFQHRVAVGYRDDREKEAEVSALDRFYDDRLRALSKDKVDDMYEYSRHRQRVCRAWAVSPILIIGALWVSFRSAQMPELELACWVASIVLFVLGGLSLYTWEALVATEIIRIRRTAALAEDG